MLRIAICESVRWDQDYLKKIVSGYMDQRGICCSIQCFGGGFEFLDYVSSRGSFHIALINASMERFNGIETAKELREYDGPARLYLCPLQMNSPSAPTAWERSPIC